MDRIPVTVSSEEEADQLRADFAELLARVNGDLMTHSINRNSPLSVENAVLHAEQSIEYHLRAFSGNENLQKLAPNIKERFRDNIRAQARNIPNGK